MIQQYTREFSLYAWERFYQWGEEGNNNKKKGKEKWSNWDWIPSKRKEEEDKDDEPRPAPRPLILTPASPITATKDTEIVLRRGAAGAE